jgi:hypothetical protein
VLFSSLKRKAVRRSTSSVDRNAYETPRKNATVFITGCKEASAWSAKTERDPESLGRANNNVCAELAWGSDEAAGEKVRRNCDKCTSNMCGIDCGRKLSDRTRRTGM